VRNRSGSVLVYSTFYYFPILQVQLAANLVLRKKRPRINIESARFRRLLLLVGEPHLCAYAGSHLRLLVTSGTPRLHGHWPPVRSGLSEPILSFRFPFASQ